MTKIENSTLAIDNKNMADLVIGEPSENFAYRVDIDRGTDVWDYIKQNHALLNGENRGTFFDLGGRDGKLKILLGSEKGVYDKALHISNKKEFAERFQYFGCDLYPSGPTVVAGDLCADNYIKNNKNMINFFDVIYSNNVFEHLYRPWVTVRHIGEMLKLGGLCCIVAPFAQRYHKSPDDYFRYTHKGIINLFRHASDMKFEIVETGYDTYQRRMNVYGRRGDAVVADEFGGWRETWYVVTILRKVDAY